MNRLSRLWRWYRLWRFNRSVDRFYKRGGSFYQGETEEEKELRRRGLESLSAYRKWPIMGAWFPDPPVEGG